MAGTRIDCRHNFYPYIEGIDKPLDNKPDAKENEELYNLNQQQRLLERRVRSAKRQVEAFKSAVSVNDNEGLKQDLAAARKKLAKANANLKQFVGEHEELTMRRDRTKIGSRK